MKSVIQIGILDFTLFPEEPEFYATYKLMNVKTHSLYSDKLTMAVLDLSRSDLATKEDEEIRRQCEVREDFYRRQRTQQNYATQLEKQVNVAQSKLDEINAELNEINAELEAKDAELEAMNAELESKSAELESKSAELEAKDAEIARLRALLEEKK